MSFLVFMLGALLSLGGVAVIYSGYGIVEVERGWTSVLAGTTALSAGIVTIGIGFILRSLTRLQAFLEAEKGFLPLLSELALYQARQNLRQSSPPVPGIESKGSAALAGSPTDLARSLQATVETGLDIFAGTEQSVHSRLDLADVRAQTESAGPPELAFGNNAEGARPEPISGEAMQRLDQAAEETAALRPNSLSSGQGRETEAAVPHVGVTSGQASMGVGDAADASDLEIRKITARYEAEGTSYVMYSDGSVDALSERGAFHFRSLTELKAFIEAQG